MSRLGNIGDKLVSKVVFLVQLQDRVIFSKLPRTIKQVLFVCKGNICRSPMAAHYLAARLSEVNEPIISRSAGLDTTDGKKADPMAKAMSLRHGISLDAHTTTRLSQELVDQADLVLAMEFSQAHRILRQFRNAKEKVFLLGHFNGRNPVDIPDPYGGTPVEFDNCYRVIKQCCDNLLARLTTTDRFVSGR